MKGWVETRACQPLRSLLHCGVLWLRLGQARQPCPYRAAICLKVLWQANRLSARHLPPKSDGVRPRNSAGLSRVWSELAVLPRGITV